MTTAAIIPSSHQIDSKTGRPPHEESEPIENVAPGMMGIAEERDGKCPADQDKPIG